MPQAKLAFICGYLAGSASAAGISEQGQDALLKWAAQRQAEADRLCKELAAQEKREDAVAKIAHHN